PLQEVMKENRVRLARIRAPQENEIGLLNLPVGTGPASGPEHCRQTGDTRRVSGAVTAVDVIAANDQPGKLLGHEVRLVAGLRAAEQSERLRAALCDGSVKALSRAGQRLIPRGGPETTLLAHERFSESDV